METMIYVNASPFLERLNIVMLGVSSFLLNMYEGSRLCMSFITGNSIMHMQDGHIKDQMMMIE